MPQLVFIDGRRMGSVVPLEGRVTVGKAEDNTVILEDGGICEHHAEVVRARGRFVLRALDPQARVSVNGTAVREHALTHGDLILLGTVTILFSEERAETPSDVFTRETPTTPPYAAGATTTTTMPGYADPEAAVRALAQEESLQQHLETLLRIGNELNRMANLDEMCRRLPDMIAQILPADRIFLLVRGPDGAVRARGQWFGREEAKGEQRISRTILDCVLERREAVLFSDVLPDERFRLRQSIVEQRIRSAIAVPILRGDHVLGALYADSVRTGRGYRQSDLKLLNGIAAQAAMALENAQKRRETEEYAQALEWLAEAARELSSTLSPQAVARACVENAARIFRSRRVTLMMHDEREDVLRVAYSNCIPEDQWPHVRVPPGEGPSGLALRENRAVLERETEVIEPGGGRRYRTKSFIVAPIPAPHDDVRRRGRAIGVISLTEREDGIPYTENDRQLLSAFASQVGIALSNARLFDRATTDSLTGLLSRQYLFLLFEDTLETRKEACVLMLDLDHFKKVNDTYMHQRGDEVLAEFGRRVREVVPAGTLVGRYGGEEFVVVLPGATLEEGVEIARRIHRRIVETPFPTSAGPIPITASIGVARSLPGETAADLVHRADQALYRAKQAGRNRVEVAGGPAGGATAGACGAAP